MFFNVYTRNLTCQLTASAACTKLQTTLFVLEPQKTWFTKSAETRGRCVGTSACEDSGG